MKKLCTAGNLPRGSLWTCLIDHCSGKNNTFSVFFHASDSLSRGCWETHQALFQGVRWDSWGHCDLVHRESCSMMERSLGVTKWVFKYLLSCSSMFCNEVSDSAQPVVSSRYVLQSVAWLPLCPSTRLTGLLGFLVPVLYSLGQSFWLYSPAYSTPRAIFVLFTWLWAVMFLWRDFLAFGTNNLHLQRQNQALVTTHCPSSLAPWFLN